MSARMNLLNALEALEYHREAADRAIDFDMTAHMYHGREYHRIAGEILAATGTDPRPAS